MPDFDIFVSCRTHEQAVHLLERLRWNGRPTCPNCRNAAVVPHASCDRALRRWKCRDCARTFTVTVGTLFHRTHVPLQQWFMVIVLDANFPTSVSELARNAGLRRATVSDMLRRLRSARKDRETRDLLRHLVKIFTVRV